MENGNTLNNLRNDTGYNGLNEDKMTLIYKVPPYCHPNKRPTQTVGGSTTQGNSVSMLDERVQQMPGVQGILQHTQNNVHSPQQHSLYGSPNKVHPNQKMVLQLHRDPKTGNLMMMNNVRPQNIILPPGRVPGAAQIASSAPRQPQSQLSPGQVTSQQVANHGYHPGRHLHHQLQLKHLPQGGQAVAAQLSHVHQAPQIIQPRPQQQEFQTTRSNYENITYTRTYPQTSPHNNPYNYPSLRPVTRYVAPQYQQMLVQNHMRLASQQQQQSVQATEVLASQPRYPYQNHVVSNSRAVTTERLSHFDYGEQDEVSNSQGLHRTGSAYQQVIENEDKSTLRVTQSSGTPVSSYSPVYVSPQPAQIIGQLRPNQTFVSQPNIISSQSSPQFRAAHQPYVIRNQIRSSVPQTSVLPSRPPNVVASPGNPTSTDYSTVRPVILTAQQAGQTFQSSPVVVQINGGKSIRGSIVSLNTQQAPKQITPAPNNSTHVYFTIPQGNSAAKFIKTPNGHLKPLNGVALQNSLSQSKMYTVRYVTPKTEEGKPKQHFTIYSPIAPSNNNVKIVTSAASKSNEKVILPKSVPSTPELCRKRKLTPTKAPTPQPSKLTRIEPKPPQTSTQHTELIQRVSKSLEGDREAVQKPDCNTAFESFPDAFRKLMKYHIFFEPDTKDSNLKRVDKLHEEISQKLINRKENLFKKYYSRFVEDSARPIPRFYESTDMVSLLQRRLLDDREDLQLAKEELKKAKEDRAREEQRAAENISPNPEGHID